MSKSQKKNAVQTKKNEQISKWCLRHTDLQCLSQFTSQTCNFVASATTLLHVLTMLAAAWHMINDNDGACGFIKAVLDTVLQCHVIFLLLSPESVVVASSAIIIELQLMHWAHNNFGA